MQRTFAALLLSLSAALCGPTAHAQSDASDLSVLPVASVVGMASAAATVSVVVPAALSTAGVLVVKAVETSARGTVYLLERASDGVRVSIEVARRGLEKGALSVGATVSVTVIGAGVLLSAAGEVLAFLPNAAGQALLHNERVAH